MKSKYLHCYSLNYVCKVFTFNLTSIPTVVLVASEERRALPSFFEHIDKENNLAENVAQALTRAASRVSIKRSKRYDILIPLVCNNRV